MVVDVPQNSIDLPPIHPNVEMLTLALSPSLTRIGQTFAVLVGLAIPISTAAENLGALLLVVFSLQPRLWSGWRFSLQQPVVLSSLALYGLFVLGAVYTTTPESAPGMLLKMRPYLLFPAFFVSCLVLKVRQGIILGFISGAFLSLVLSITSWLTNLPLLVGIPGDWTVFRGHTYHNLFIAWLVLSALSVILSGYLPRKFNWFAWTIFLAGLFDILFLVQGRTGHVILLLMLIFVLTQWNWRKGGSISLAILLIGMPLVWWTSDTFRERVQLAEREASAFSIGSTNETSVGLRLGWYRDTALIISNAPLIGHGTGSFKTEFRRHKGGPADLSVQASPVIATGNPHNDYLWFAVELGIVGVIALFAFFGSAIWTAKKSQKEQGWMASIIILSIAIGSLANSFITDNVTGTGYIILLCALLTGPLIPNPINQSKGESHD
jgi:O-antigen ligase